MTGATRHRDLSDVAWSADAAGNVTATALPEHANPMRPAKRPRGPPAAGMMAWPEVDEASRIFSEAGKAFASTPGTSDDDDQAMDLLVRLWSPSSIGGGDDADGFVMSALQHPTSNVTSPSTTSPVPDDVGGIAGSPSAPAPAAPRHAAPPLLDANGRPLPVAHAWPLPAHLQPQARAAWAAEHGAPGGMPPRARPPPPYPHHWPRQRVPGRGPPPPPGSAAYYMPPRPLKHPAAPPGAPPHAGVHRPPPPPPPAAAGPPRGALPLAHASIDLRARQAEQHHPSWPPPPDTKFHRPARHDSTRPPPAGYPAPTSAPASAASTRPASATQWHNLIDADPSHAGTRPAANAPAAASAGAHAAPHAGHPGVGHAKREWHHEAIPPPAGARYPTSRHHAANGGPIVRRLAPPSHMPSYADHAHASPHHPPDAKAYPTLLAPPTGDGAPVPTGHELALAPAAAAAAAHPSSAGAPPRASMTSCLSLSMTLGGGSGRNLAERKEWTVDEDRQICRSVRRHGFKWRLVAADVPGRSDDAVRNRYNRVKELEHVVPTAAELALEAAEHGAPAEIKPSSRRGRKLKPKIPPADLESSKESGSSHSSDEDKDRVERVSWSRTEDETIVRSVQELGNKWAKIAERLPGRTEHAIRNRFARLQSLASRGNPIMLSSGEGLPIGISLVPTGL